MKIKFDFELENHKISDPDVLEALDKLRGFIRQRLNVLKDEIGKYPNGYSVFYITTEEIDVPFKVFGYPDVLGSRMRQTFQQDDFEYILSQISKILPP